MKSHVLQDIMVKKKVCSKKLNSLPMLALFLTGTSLLNKCLSQIISTNQINKELQTLEQLQLVI